MSEISTISNTPFVNWPTPSPTSSLNINVRYYTLLEEDTGETVKWDLGAAAEKIIEALYEGFQLPSRGYTPLQFEQMVRDIYQSRLQITATAITAHIMMCLVDMDEKSVMRWHENEERENSSMRKRVQKVMQPEGSTSLLDRFNPFKKSEASELRPSKEDAA